MYRAESPSRTPGWQRGRGNLQTPKAGVKFFLATDDTPFGRLISQFAGSLIMRFSVLGRASFLLLALAMSLLAKAMSFAQDGSSAAYSQRDRAQSLNRDVSYHIAPQITAGYKTATVDLRVVETVNRFNGIDLKHRSYNGGLVGPTICVWPGQTLKVRLQNDLDAKEKDRHHCGTP